ncbi:protein rough sheath 2-like [Pistacia vera]|uniref:protein rough sheath 2-like n=1 Tax=Pistacia vera TaxID=55513 RepID=UPI001263516D|nr:protein rough sheath 2-like [Pistacia vera]
MYYLKPGIKKGSLTLKEQSLVISLQAKYGNKWKKIASEVPGRTAKRLGKWWEVFKEKQSKQLHKQRREYSDQEGNVIQVTSALVLSPEKVAQWSTFIPGQQVGTLIQYCKELEEGKQSWLQHKKEATWRLSRLEQQLESEKARKRRGV